MSDIKFWNETSVVSLLWAILFLCFSLSFLHCLLAALEYVKAACYLDILMSPPNREVFPRHCVSTHTSFNSLLKYHQETDRDHCVINCILLVSLHFHMKDMLPVCYNLLIHCVSLLHIDKSINAWDNPPMKRKDFGSQILEVSVYDQLFLPHFTMPHTMVGCEVK